LIRCVENAKPIPESREATSREYYIDQRKETANERGRQCGIWGEGGAMRTPAGSEGWLGYFRKYII
jgi:hypothetical protein